MNKKSLLIIITIIFSILAVSALYGCSKHKSTDINEDIKSTNIINELEDIDKTNNTITKNIKSFELEKPPFID